MRRGDSGTRLIGKKIKALLFERLSRVIKIKNKFHFIEKFIRAIYQTL